MTLNITTQDITLTKDKTGKYHVVWYVDGIPFKGTVTSHGVVVPDSGNHVPDFVKDEIQNAFFPKSVLTKYTDGSKFTASYEEGDKDIQVNFYYEANGESKLLGTLEFPTDEERRKFFYTMMQNRVTSVPGLLLSDDFFDDIFTCEPFKRLSSNSNRKGKK